MTLTLPISSELEARLAVRAKSAGVDVPTYAATLLEQATKVAPSMVLISGGVADDFAKSGMTDDELGEFLEVVKHEMRADKRGRKVS